MSQVIPFGDRILVRRKKVGDKVGKDSLIYAPDSLKERNTDIAVVAHIPDDTFADKAIIENSENIIKAMSEKAANGDSDALVTLLRLNEYLKLKSIQVGDVVMISKYVGTDFTSNDAKDEMTLVSASDVIGVITKG